MVKYIYFYLGSLALVSSVRPKKKKKKKESYLLQKQHQKGLVWFSMCNSSHEYLVISISRRQMSQKHSRRTQCLWRNLTFACFASSTYGAYLWARTRPLMHFVKPVSSRYLLWEVTMRKKIDPAYCCAPEQDTIKISKLQYSFQRAYDSFIWGITFSLPLVRAVWEFWKMYIAVLLWEGCFVWFSVRWKITKII